MPFASATGVRNPLLPRWKIVPLIVGLLGAVPAPGCDGGDSVPTSPSPPTGSGGGGGGTPPMTATITIGPNGVSPAAVTIARGGRVTVTNNSTRVHEISSDPHPNHTDCVEINALGALSPGETGMTAPFSVARRCGFHDHLDHDNPALRGSITIQ